LLAQIVQKFISKVDMLTMAAYECFAATKMRAKLHFTLHILTNHYNIINYGLICAHDLFLLSAGKLLPLADPRRHNCLALQNRCAPYLLGGASNDGKGTLPICRGV
jgi:hypothetical protein